jgi:hypothetical protein
MRQISTSVDIDAPSEKVWSILADFAVYPEWNPFIVRVDGTLQPGARLTVTLQPPGRRKATFRPRVTALEPNRELRWLGHLVVPGLFDGEHIHRLEPSEGGGTRYRQEERFDGILVPLTGSMLGATEQGFRAMNAALKERAERAPAPPVPPPDPREADGSDR